MKILKDLAKIVSPSEIRKIKKRVAKMQTKEVEEELKLRLSQFNELTKEKPEEKKDD